MALNLQDIINNATGGTSLGQSMLPTSPSSSLLSSALGVSSYQSTPVVTTPPKVNTTPDASKLGQSTVTAPVPAKTNTLNTALGAKTTGAVATQPPAPTPTPTPAPKPQDTVLSRLTEIAGIQKTQGDFTNEAMTEQGVYEKQQQVQDIKNQYEAKDRYYEKKRRELEKNAQGMLQGGLQDQLDDLDRQKNQELADIAIQYNAAQGNYKVAFDIAQAKVDAKFEPLKNEIETLKSMYTLYQNDMTESEKMQAQAAINEREQATNFQMQKELAAYKAQLDAQYSATSGGGGVGGASEQLYVGLTGPTATAVRAAVGKFGSEPIVQNFATIQDGYIFANSIKTNTKNPADDQALIYSLAKALDPGSVVREGEYATAQKYAQSWISAYGKGVTQALAGTGFLSETARENIRSVIKTKYEASKQSYTNLQNQYANRISTLTGRGDGEQFIMDYTTPIQQTTQTTAPEEIFKRVVQPTQTSQETGVLGKIWGWLTS